MGVCKSLLCVQHKGVLINVSTTRKERSKRYLTVVSSKSCSQKETSYFTKQTTNECKHTARKDCLYFMQSNITIPFNLWAAHPL
jgi:hypothetical protein